MFEPYDMCHPEVQTTARQFFLLKALEHTDDVDAAIRMAERMRKYVEGDRGAGEKDPGAAPAGEMLSAPVQEAVGHVPEQPAAVHAGPLLQMLAALPRETLAAAERAAASRERRDRRYEELHHRSLEEA